MKWVAENCSDNKNNNEMRKHESDGCNANGLMERADEESQQNVKNHSSVGSVYESLPQGNN